MSLVLIGDSLLVVQVRIPLHLMSPLNQIAGGKSTHGGTFGTPAVAVGWTLSHWCNGSIPAFQAGREGSSPS